MITVLVQNNQSIWDLAIQHYGSADGVKQLIEDNPWLNFEDNIAPGSKVKISENVIDKNVVDFLAKKGMVPATAFYDSTVNTISDFNSDFNNDF